jgi:hypothetical protein
MELLLPELGPIAVRALCCGRGGVDRRGTGAQPRTEREPAQARAPAKRARTLRPPRPVLPIDLPVGALSPQLVAHVTQVLLKHLLYARDQLPWSAAARAPLPASPASHKSARWQSVRRPRSNARRGRPAAARDTRG